MNLVELDHALRKLRLSGMAATLEARLRQAQSEKQAPIDLISALVTDELVRRQDRRLGNGPAASAGWEVRTAARACAPVPCGSARRHGEARRHFRFSESTDGVLGPKSSDSERGMKRGEQVPSDIANCLFLID